MWLRKSMIATLILCFVRINAYADLDVGVVVADHYECGSYDHTVIDGKAAGRTTLPRRGRLYIDDYSVSISSAQEWCYE